MEYQLIESSLSPEKQFTTTVIERVLTNRGIKLEEIPHYLNTTDEDILDFNLIDNLKEGAQMLAKHINNNDDIYLIVDCDADGFTSAALLMNYLNLLFPGYVQNHIYYVLHSGKQHGIEDDFIPEIIQKKCKLVICPDSSSNDYEAHKKLADYGIDVLVIDHHEAEKVSEYACVINNQLCDYPNKTLSGVGMVYKFCCYLDSIMGVNNADLFLDLVAIGMTADLMDLRNFETKHLIFKGIKNLRNPFIVESRKAQSYSIDKDGGLNPHTIGFYIGPAINAVIRMGTYEEKQLLFESMLDYLGYELIPSTKRGCKGQFEPRVIQVCRNCNNIRNKQNKLRDASIDLIRRKIKDNDLDKNKILLIPMNPGELSPNLTGLVANKIMSEYKHPTLLLLKKPDPETGEILLEGSGRGYESKGFDDFRQFIKDSDYFYLAEGHAQAFGSGMLYNNMDEFIKYSNKELKDLEFNPSYKVDFVWNSNNFNSKDIIDLAGLNNICGQGVSQPYVVIERLEINKYNTNLYSRDKNPTLRIALTNGVSLIQFGFNPEEYDALMELSEKRNVYIDIVGTASINEYQGKIYGQIKIEDYQLCEMEHNWLAYF